MKKKDNPEDTIISYATFFLKIDRDGKVENAWPLAYKAEDCERCYPRIASGWFVDGYQMYANNKGRRLREAFPLVLNYQLEQEVFRYQKYFDLTYPEEVPPFSSYTHIIKRAGKLYVSDQKNIYELESGAPVVENMMGNKEFLYQFDFQSPDDSLIFLYGMVKNDVYLWEPKLWTYNTKTLVRKEYYSTTPEQGWMFSKWQNHAVLLIQEDDRKMRIIRFNIEL